MNVLSIFDGMSCGQIALNKLGINYDKYFACEIDKYAMQVTQNNFPDTIQLGDVQFVTKVTFGTNKIYLLMGGSPCQGFSFAGKELNFDDPRSALFFEYFRLVKELNPKYFLLENVVMKQEYQDVISKYMGCDPIRINSALVSAQTRKRLYWTNIPGIGQPEDKGIILKDIIEKGDSCSLTSTSQEVGVVEKAGRIVGRRLNEEGKRADYNKDIPIEQRIELNNNPDKTNCLSTVQKDNIIIKTASFADRTNVGNQNKVSWRKLTPLECERLQTVPDGYTLVMEDGKQKVSNSQRYKMLGNGWTVDVITHILKNMEL